MFIITKIIPKEIEIKYKAIERIKAERKKQKQQEIKTLHG